MSKKEEKMVILDLTQDQYIPVVPCAHEGPVAKVFFFYTEKGERVNTLVRIKHDTEKIVAKGCNGMQSLKVSQTIQKNLLEYFKFKNQKPFKDFMCHEFTYYLNHGSLDKKAKYKLEMAEEFEIGDTILMGKFKKTFWRRKTIPKYIEHSAICIANTEEGPVFVSKLGPDKKVIVATLVELKEIYYCTKSCAKMIWLS